VASNQPDEPRDRTVQYKVVRDLFDDIVYDYFMEQIPERDAVKRLEKPGYKISESCQELP